MKKFVLALVVITLSFAAMLSTSASVRKSVSSTLFPSKSYSDSVAASFTRIVQNPRQFGYKSSEDAVEALSKRHWYTGDGGTRTITIEPVSVGGFGWPEVVQNITVKVTWNADGEKEAYQYFL